MEWNWLAFASGVAFAFTVSFFGVLIVANMAARADQKSYDPYEGPL